MSPAHLLLAFAALFATVPEAPVRLTQSALPQSRPAWSADGRWIACVESGGAEDVVLIAGAEDGLERMVSAAGAPLVGAPMWLPDAPEVVWVREDRSLHSMAVDGRLARAELSLASRPTGVFPRENRLLAHSSREVVETPVRPPDQARRLLAAPLDRSLEAVSSGLLPGELLIGDGPEVFRWTEDGGWRDLHLPAAGIIAYTNVLAASNASRILAVARTSAGDRFVLADVNTGETTRVAAGGAVSQIAGLPDGGFLAIIDGRLLRHPPGLRDPIALTSPDVRVGGFALSPDGTAIALALSGLDDTDGDGRVTEDDPSNLYLLGLSAL